MFCCRRTVSPLPSCRFTTDSELLPAEMSSAHAKSNLTLGRPLSIELRKLQSYENEVSVSEPTNTRGTSVDSPHHWRACWRTGQWHVPDHRSHRDRTSTHIRMIINPLSPSRIGPQRPAQSASCNKGSDFGMYRFRQAGFTTNSGHRPSHDCLSLPGITFNSENVYAILGYTIRQQRESFADECLLWRCDWVSNGRIIASSPCLSSCRLVPSLCPEV